MELELSFPICADMVQQVSYQTMLLGPAASCLGSDLLSFMNALNIKSAVLGGYDWGGRAACVVSAYGRNGSQHLSGNSYNIQDISKSVNRQNQKLRRHIGTNITYIMREDVKDLRRTGVILPSSCGLCGLRIGNSHQKNLNKLLVLSIIWTLLTW